VLNDWNVNRIDIRSEDARAGVAGDQEDGNSIKSSSESETDEESASGKETVGVQLKKPSSEINAEFTGIERLLAEALASPALHLD
jgi:hypothetical protein